MIKLQRKTPIEDRKEFAGCLARLVNAESDAAPYMPQDGDASHWCIDPNGNDFWVKFCDENPQNFTIRCRYGYQSARLLSIAMALVTRVEYEYAVI